MTLDQVIDLEPEVNLEFKVFSFEYARDEKGRLSAPDIEIESWLDLGWQLDNQIISPPFVTLIFSREKEEKETTNNE